MKESILRSVVRAADIHKYIGGSHRNQSCEAIPW